MRRLTSLSALGATPAGLEARQGASPALPSAGGPLNPTTAGDPADLSPVGIGEGRSNPGFRPGGTNRLRIPVVDAEGKPLMPCTPVRARLLLKKGKALARWNKLGIFYLQLKYAVEPKNQMLVVGVDPGSRYEALSVVGARDTVLNIMHESVNWVKKALEQRRRMRRARRYRKTRRRACRFDNRLSNRSWVPPSTKARWDAKLRIISQLRRMLPISHVVVEGVKAVTRKACRGWNANFSPIEVGKQYFYSQLQAILLFSA
ncbi:MAG: RRXRR domain-containing protein [Candidatus Methanomethyliales bacterium]|nr:RRXRR domain-containing protein [Candidatus Methanomethylicales archaeon]